MILFATVFWIETEENATTDLINNISMMHVSLVRLLRRFFTLSFSVLRRRWHEAPRTFMHCKYQSMTMQLRWFHMMISMFIWTPLTSDVSLGRTERIDLVFPKFVIALAWTVVLCPHRNQMESWQKIEVPNIRQLMVRIRVQHHILIHSNDSLLT